MPRLARSKVTDLTHQQEHFCQEYVRLGVASHAYKRAYRVGPKTKPDTVWQESSRLLRDPRLSARIQALQAKAAKAADITLDYLVRELVQTNERAKEANDNGDVISGTMAIAKLTGHAVDRTEVGGPNGTPIPVEITDDAKVLNPKQRAALRGALAGMAAKPRAGLKGARRS